jgi:type IV/VI secretion system ImpK/VasF family protein
VSELPLARLASDFALAVQALGSAPGASLPEPAALRSSLLALLDPFGRAARAAGLPAPQLEEARFALVVWADEVIQKADWPGRESWLREPLQQRLYRTNRGGNEFYERLARLPPAAIAVREVYWLVLALGFEGEYRDRPGERLALLSQQYELLRAARRLPEVARERQLSPAAYALDIELPRAAGSALGAGAALLGGALALAAVYGALWWLLRALGGELPLPQGL